MKYIFSLLVLVFFSLSFPLFAQDSQEPDAIPGNEEEVVYEMNQKGDQFIAVKLNADIPYKPFGNLFVGGTISLGYHHFVTDNLTLGGNLSFAYNQTIGDNVFYFVPLMFTTTYQFEFGSWEIPISLEVGVAWENYIDRMYFGLALRPEIAAYYRFNTDWSLGIHTGLYVLPQWYSDPTYNYVGLIQDVGLSFRYHF